MVEFEEVLKSFEDDEWKYGWRYRQYVIFVKPDKWPYVIPVRGNGKVDSVHAKRAKEFLENQDSSERP